MFFNCVASEKKINVLHKSNTWNVWKIFVLTMHGEIFANSSVFLYKEKKIQLFLDYM